MDSADFASSLRMMDAEKFDFTDNVWWRKEYFPFKNVDLNTEIIQFVDIISKEYKDSTYLEYFKDFSTFYRCKYVFECLEGEKNVDFSRDQSFFESCDEIEKIFDLKLRGNRPNIKIFNMYDATCSLFQDIFITNFRELDFTVDLAKRIHQIV